MRVLLLLLLFFVLVGLYRSRVQEEEEEEEEEEDEVGVVWVKHPRGCHLRQAGLSFTVGQETG